MVSKTDKDTEQSDKGALEQAPSEVVAINALEIEKLKSELDYIKGQNAALDAQVQEKTDKLRKMQIATYKITTTKQYQLIEKEAEKVELVQENKPPEFFYFPKIGMRICQCADCAIEAKKYMGKSVTHGEDDKRLYWLTGIGEFSGHSGFKEADARYIAEFLNKHPEYMHKLENLDKDRFA